jgi:hypothetical protein
MDPDYYRRAVARHREEIARLQRDKSREAAQAASESKRANEAAAAALRSRSTTSAQSKLRDAQRHEERAHRHQQKVADFESRLATEQRKLNDAERRLGEAMAAADRKLDRERQKAEREHERRMRSISSTLSQHAELHTVAAEAIKRLEYLPERIVVLFLAANPIDQAQLRLDEEVRAIAEMIRKSEHRDAVRLESRWAVRPLDVFQAINECQPTVVHFSGHGSDNEELAFQTDSGTTKLVSKEAIAETLAATSSRIQLVLFNVCYSKAQAQAVVEHVSAAIGMNTTIGDEAARIFAAQFYSAVGFGRSVANAFAQARAAIMMEGLTEADTPELFLTPGLDGEQLVLVQPSA